MNNEFPFFPHDKLKQVGIWEIPIDSDKVFMINFSVGSSWTEQELGVTPQVFLIQNTHVSQNLRISFDEGTTYFTLFPKTGLKIGLKITSVYVWGSGDSTTYDIIGFEV